MKSSIAESLVALYQYLPAGQTVSYKVESRNKTPEGRVKWLIASARYRAKRDGREFSEAITWHLCQSIPKRCPCCGVRLRYEAVSKRGKCFPDTPSLDRLDNREGYTVRNTRIICTTCNRLKNSGSLEQFRRLVGYIERERHNR